MPGLKTILGIYQTKLQLSYTHRLYTLTTCLSLSALSWCITSLVNKQPLPSTTQSHTTLIQWLTSQQLQHPKWCINTIKLLIIKLRVQVCCLQSDLKLHFFLCIFLLSSPSVLFPPNSPFCVTLISVITAMAYWEFKKTKTKVPSFLLQIIMKFSKTPFFQNVPAPRPWPKLKCHFPFLPHFPRPWPKMSFSLNFPRPWPKMSFSPNFPKPPPKLKCHFPQTFQDLGQNLNAISPKPSKTMDKIKRPWTKTPFSPNLPGLQKAITVFPNFPKLLKD